jgi:hypothetical protein
MRRCRELYGRAAQPNGSHENPGPEERDGNGATVGACHRWQHAAIQIYEHRAFGVFLPLVHTETTWSARATKSVFSEI